MKSILVKVSGDFITNPKVINWLNNLAETCNVTVICGGGVQINDILRRKFNNWNVVYDELGRRECADYKMKEFVAGVLCGISEMFRNSLRDSITVLEPLFVIDDRIVHINGDDMLKALSLGYDELYCVTKEDRKSDKILIFNEYNVNIRVFDLLE